MNKTPFLILSKKKKKYKHQWSNKTKSSETGPQKQILKGGIIRQRQVSSIHINRRTHGLFWNWSEWIFCIRMYPFFDQNSLLYLFQNLWYGWPLHPLWFYTEYSGFGYFPNRLYVIGYFECWIYYGMYIATLNVCSCLEKCWYVVSN